MTLKLMTFNLRYAKAPPPNPWTDRCPVAIECLRREQADVIGTQEGLFLQVRNIADALAGYSWIGLGRGGGSRDEFAAVFYRTDRLEPLEFDHFWLSDTPDVVASRTWGNRCVRMVTWVRFRDRASGNEFYFWNTHLDHEVEEARVKAAELIRWKVGELPAGVPVLLVGDFNATAAASETYSLLAAPGGFTDTWTTAAQRGPEIRTFHGYGPIQPGRGIDWILARGDVRTQQTEVVTYERDGQRPSDHFPVTAVVEF